MQWYDRTISTLKRGETYSRAKLMDKLRADNPSLSQNSFQWAMGTMVKTGRIERIGHDEYALSSGKQLPLYTPMYSDEAITLIEKISKQYPYICFTVFETTLLNEFLNHLIAQNTIFVQAEKDSSVFVFRYLQEGNSQNLMYRPTKKDFSLYWKSDSIIVTDLITEAPLSQSRPHDITIEKLLVDVYCDKLIRGTYGKSEYKGVMEQAKATYLLDKVKLLRYARRRNKEEEIARIFDGNE